MVNSEGASGEKNVWGKQASWVDYTGKVDGQPAGVAILAHPSNPKYPPRWHARAYGLFAVNPFGYKQFIGEKEGPGGGLQMTAGQSMRLRYRVIIHGSEINSLNLPDIYQDYLKQVKK